jgi:hypothetical protein
MQSDEREMPVPWFRQRTRAQGKTHHLTVFLKLLESQIPIAFA